MVEKRKGWSDHLGLYQKIVKPMTIAGITNPEIR